MSEKKNLFAIKEWIKNNKYFLILSALVLLAIFLRFYDYNNRWGLAADQARDILVSRVALKLHKLPLIGPFSASGPFVFGPYWYWLLLVPVGLFNTSFLAPWIFLTLLNVVAVFIMFLIGKKLMSTPFGLLLSLLAAVSPEEVQLSTNLIMSAFVGFLSVGIFYFFICYIKDRRLIHIACMALLCGIAINTHFEAVPLIALLPIAIIFGKKKWSHIGTLIGLFLIPFLPLVIFNFQSHSYELSHIFLTNTPQQHMSLARTLLEIAKREIVFITHTLPILWERLIVGLRIPLIGYVMPICFLLSVYLMHRKRLLHKEIVILLILAASILVIVGYYKGVFFQNFFAFSYPLLFICTGLICYTLYRYNKYIGSITVGLLLVASLYADGKTIAQATNNDAIAGHALENTLIRLYPQEKFVLYNYTSLNKDKGLTLSLFLDVDNKIGRKGIKIGMAYFGAPINDTVLFDDHESTGLQLYNLQGSSYAKLKQEGFIPYDASRVYASVEQWYK